MNLKSKLFLAALIISPSFAFAQESAKPAGAESGQSVTSPAVKVKKPKVAKGKKAVVKKPVVEEQSAAEPVAATSQEQAATPSSDKGILMIKSKSVVANDQMTGLARNGDYNFESGVRALRQDRSQIGLSSNYQSSGSSGTPVAASNGGTEFSGLGVLRNGLRGFAGINLLSNETPSSAMVLSLGAAAGFGDVFGVAVSLHQESNSKSLDSDSKSYLLLSGLLTLGSVDLDLILTQNKYSIGSIFKLSPDMSLLASILRETTTLSKTESVANNLSLGIREKINPAYAVGAMWTIGQSKIVDNDDLVTTNNSLSLSADMDVTEKFSVGLNPTYSQSVKKIDQKVVTGTYVWGTSLRGLLKF
jgi:hypothetical protein